MHGPAARRRSSATWATTPPAIPPGLAGRAAVSEKLRAAEVEQGLPQPSGGRKEYKDDDGKVTKVVEWFGYKLHLLVDVKHEVALAYHITDTKAGDNERIAALVEQAKANLPAGSHQDAGLRQGGRRRRGARVAARARGSSR